MEHPIHTLADGAASPALTSRLDAGIAAWVQLVDAVREAALHAQVVAAVEGTLGESGVGRLRQKVAVAARLTLVRTALAQLPVRQDPDALIVPDSL